MESLHLLHHDYMRGVHKRRRNLWTFPSGVARVDLTSTRNLAGVREIISVSVHMVLFVCLMLCLLPFFAHSSRELWRKQSSLGSKVRFYLLVIYPQVSRSISFQLYFQRSGRAWAFFFFLLWAKLNVRSF